MTYNPEEGQKRNLLPFFHYDNLRQETIHIKFKMSHK
jgi:hypothetical protein